jgi:hypothetical protein
MEMVPRDYRKLGRIGIFVKTKNEQILNRFLETGETCVEIVGYTNKDAKSCQGSLNLYIRRHNMQNMVYAIYRKGHIFLVRVDKIED